MNHSAEANRRRSESLKNMYAARKNKTAQRSTTIQERLSVGEVYMIGGRKMTLIQKFERLARFKSEKGFTESFSYWDLEHMKKGAFRDS